MNWIDILLTVLDVLVPFLGVAFVFALGFGAGDVYRRTRRAQIKHGPGRGAYSLGYTTPGELFVKMRRAIADPGAVVTRERYGDDEYEPVTSWSTRAVMTVLRVPTHPTRVVNADVVDRAE